MKNLLGLLVLIAVVVSCSLGKKDAPTKPGATSPVSDSSATSPSSALTLESFNQLRDGMRYEEVARILGGEGTETNSSSFESMKTVTYKWEGEKYAKLYTTFRNEKLASKSQANLK